MLHKLYGPHLWCGLYLPQEIVLTTPKTKNKHIYWNAICTDNQVQNIVKLQGKDMSEKFHNIVKEIHHNCLL